MRRVARASSAYARVAARARADTLVSIYVAAVYVYLSVYVLCMRVFYVCMYVYVCMCVCNAPLRALHRRKHPR